MKFPKIDITFEESVDYCILLICGTAGIILGAASAVLHIGAFIAVKAMETATNKLTDEDNKGEGIVLADMKDMSPVDCVKSAAEIFKASFSLGGSELTNTPYQKRDAGELEGEMAQAVIEEPQTKGKKATPKKKSSKKEKVISSEKKEDSSSTESPPASSEVSEEEKQLLAKLTSGEDTTAVASEALPGSAEDSDSSK